jgi:hypothetical protein
MHSRGDAWPPARTAGTAIPGRVQSTTGTAAAQAPIRWRPARYFRFTATSSTPISCLWSRR